MSIEGGLKGDLAPKPKPEASKLRGSLVSPKSSVEASEPKPEPFSDEWLKANTFLYKGNRPYKVNQFVEDARGQRVALEEIATGGRRNMTKAEFIYELKRGEGSQWKLKE